MEKTGKKVNERQEKKSANGRSFYYFDDDAILYSSPTQRKNASEVEDFV